MTRPSWLCRAAKNRHRHAIEQVPRRWREVDAAIQRERAVKFDFHTGTKYHCFLDWIRLVKNHKLYRTSSVKKMLLKRKHRAFASTRLLKERGARRCRSIHQDMWADLRAVFCRWSTYAFDQIRWRNMTVLGTKRVRLKLLQKMFSVLKSEAGFGVIAGRTPWVRRIDADLGVCSLYFVAPRRKTDLLNNLRKSNAVHRKAVADGARNGPTFKKFMDSVGGAAMARLYSEQAMLLKAFELKGDLRYKDVDSCVEIEFQAPHAIDAMSCPASPVGFHTGRRGYSESAGRRYRGGRVQGRRLPSWCQGLRC